MVVKDIAEHIAYTTFPGLNFEILINGSPKDLTSTVISVAIRYGNSAGKIVKNLTNGTGITVTDAVAGKFKWDEFDADFKPGKYYYDIRFTDGVVSKIYFGGEWPIVTYITPKNA